MHVKNSDGYCKYKMAESNERQIEYELMCASSTPEPQCNGVIGCFVDNKLNIIDELIENMMSNDDENNQPAVLTDDMIETIEQGDVMVVTDASVKS